MAITYSTIVTQLKNDVHNKTGSIPNLRALINQAVQDVNSKVDLRGTKRRAGIPNGFFKDIYRVPAPTDLKGTKIVDLDRLRQRADGSRWTKVTEEEFLRRKTTQSYLVAVSSDLQYKTLLVNSFGNSSTFVLNEMDAVTGANIGTFVASGDASNLEADSWNYLTGSASIRFDTASGGATAVLTNSTITATNLAGLKDISNGFLSFYAPSKASADGVTSVTLEWGEDSSNYFSKTVSVAHDGNTFKAGWNILSFQWLGATEVGSPTGAAITYVKITVNKSTSLAATSDWRFDQLIFIKGDLHETVYYSKNRWKSAAGTLLEDSTADDDILLADEDEEPLVFARIAMRASRALRESTDVNYWNDEYKTELQEQKRLRKSEALMLESTYHEFEQI